MRDERKERPLTHFPFPLVTLACLFPSFLHSLSRGSGWDSHETRDREGKGISLSLYHVILFLRYSVRDDIEKRDKRNRKEI